MEDNKVKFLYGLEEIGVEHNDLVGKKCSNLGEMTKAGLRVPLGFALSVDAYDEFLHSTGALAEMKEHVKAFKAELQDVKKFENLTLDLRNILETKSMPEALKHDVIAHYRRLCDKAGQCDLPVATRSAGAKSRPGQYETFLNVGGQDEVLTHIIKVWGSTLNTRSLMWRCREGLPLEYDPIGVAVLQMVNASKAGVLLTLNPMTGDRTKFAIEANWGLGESVVSGETNPDFYLIDRITLEIIDVKVSKKTHQFVPAEKGRGARYVTVPPEKQDIPCLNDDELRELVRGGERIENHFGVPQDIEWVIDDRLPFPENIFFVQTRPEKTLEKHKQESISSGDKSFMELLVAKLTNP
jgi:pyruvate,water dikinase